MSTIKDVLCLLAIFVDYGITGRLDYEDAVRLEQTLQERQLADCLMASAPADHDALARSSALPFDPPSRPTDEDLPEDGQPCARLAL